MFNKQFELFVKLHNELIERAGLDPDKYERQDSFSVHIDIENGRDMKEALIEAFDLVHGVDISDIYDDCYALCKGLKFKITDDIRNEVLEYLELDEEDNEDLSDEFYAFYYRCMKEDMHFADADRYAALNTLFDYDIGIDNAIAINQWMYENDEEIYELLATNKRDKKLIEHAVAERGLNLDFSKWIKEDYKEYKFFFEN